MLVCARFLEPSMLIGGVVDDEIHDDFDAALFCVLHELDEITARAMTRIDAVKV